MSTLRLFSVRGTVEWEPGSVLVWAPSEGEARMVAGSCEFDEGQDLAVSEVETDVRPERSTPHVEGRMSVLRDFWFHCEGDDECDVCGLAVMDGQWPLCCEEGRSCPDCGPCDACRERRSADGSVGGA